MERKSDNIIDTRHVDVLDGIRAIAILIVCWYHIWQQSWLMPIVKTPFLAFLGVRSINFDFIPRTGYMLVDCMLLISGFCLFLPHARSMVEGGPVPEPLTFYKKRLIRILPSYYLAVIPIFFFSALPSGAYATPGEAMLELFSNLTFTQMFFPGPYLHANINGVLWTVCVEMQFYLLFPLLAAAFRKKPLWTYLAMLAVSALYIRFFALPNPGNARLTVNQLPAFFGVFANGILSSYVFVFLAKRIKRNQRLSLLATLTAFLAILGIRAVLKGAAGAESVPVYQLQYRFLFSLTLTAFLLSAAFSAKWLRALLSNRVTRFVAGISYNLYIWHQWLAVKCKAWRIPYWEGATPPNFTGNRPWQWRYTLCCFLFAILLATFITYFFERPLAERLAAGRMKSRMEQ